MSKSLSWRISTHLASWPSGSLKFSSKDPQDEPLPIQVWSELVKAQDYSQQLSSSDTVVLLWFAECAAKVGNDLFTMLPLLGQHSTHTRIAGIQHWGFRQSRAKLGERCSTVFAPLEIPAFLNQLMQGGSDGGKAFDEPPVVQC